jgi:hypothetical protein
MTDFRTLCAELLETLENAIRVIYNEDGTKHISTADPVIAKADAALAQPEPQGATDEEIMRLACSLLGYEFTPSLISNQENGIGALEALPSELLAFARAALARWGRPAIEPVPQQQEVE